MSKMQSFIAYSMGKARRNSLTNKEAKKMPGPGIYKQGNMNNVKHQNPKWTMKGKGKGETYSRDGPGPGQYSDGFRKFNTPNYSFGNKLSKTFYPDTSKDPGPGTYPQKSSLGRQGGYIGSRYKNKRKADNPGPGQYPIRTSFGWVGASFGQGKRSSPNLNRSNRMPGPGAYAQDSGFGQKTQGAGFGSGRKKTSISKVPGPGQYTVNDSLYRDPKAASIKGRPQTTKIDAKPGPGHYQSKSMHASPAFSIGVKTKLKELIGKDNPGPASYNPLFGSTKQSAPGINFGSPSKDKPMGDSLMPGPGQYDVRKRAGEDAPAFGIRGRHNDAKGDTKPGPGNYNPKDDSTRQGIPGTVMGTGTRSNFGGKGQGPGPGQYAFKGKLGEGSQYSFGAGERNDGSLERRAKGIPGPGTYPQSTFMGKDSQGKTIAGKAKSREPDFVPGPGTYKQSPHKNGPSYSLSGHRTEDPLLREKAKMPPPGTYDPNDKSIRFKSPGVVFGNKPKISALRGDGVPGPGQYDMNTTLEGKGVHIASKIPERIFERAPGPGQYAPKENPKFQNGPSFSIGGGGGDQAIPGKDMPGPGTYDSPGRPGTSGFRFGGEERSGLASKRNAPGPGQYSLPSRIGNEGKNIVIAGRHEEKKDINQVGPGQYKLPSSIGGPKFSMGSGDKGTKLNKNAVENPPPGTYEIDTNIGKHGSPGIVFGKDIRDKGKASTNPGPGNYALPSTLETKGITIQGRHDITEKEKAPGPGQYESKVPASKVHGGNIKFGNEVKWKMPKGSGAPGPGQYLIKLPYDKGPKIGQDLRDRPQKSTMPGPGQYNTRREEGLTYY